MYTNTTYLNETNQESLFQKLQGDSTFIHFQKVTIDLTFAMLKTVKQGGKLDSVKLKTNTEMNFSKRLSEAGVINSQEIIDLSNTQISLMNQLIQKYTAIKMIPINSWNHFIEIQNKQNIQTRISKI